MAVPRLGVLCCTGLPSPQFAIEVQMESPTKLAGERPSLHFEMNEPTLRQLREIIERSVCATREIDPAATSSPVIVTLVRGAPCVEMMNLAQFGDWQVVDHLILLGASRPAARV